MPVIECKKKLNLFDDNFKIARKYNRKEKKREKYITGKSSEIFVLFP